MEDMQKKARIMVVDDDQSIRQLICTIVQREGFPVDSAADGAEAIELLKQHSYAVILLDLMMPRVDGFGVIAHIKQNLYPQVAKPIVIVITAYADQKFKEVDATVVSGVVRKPFEVSDVGTLVRLCAEGYSNELSKKLDVSSDRAVRDFAQGVPDKREESEN